MNNYLQSLYTVRFNDCDPFKHLNNSRYLDYFMNAREEQLQQFYGFSLADSYSKGHGWVVRSHEIVYIRPALYNEKINIQSALLEVTEDQLLLEMLMLDETGNQLKAILHSWFIPVNIFTGKKEKHAPELLDFFTGKVLPGFTTGQTIYDRIAGLPQSKMQKPQPSA